MSAAQRSEAVLKAQVRVEHSSKRELLPFCAYVDDVILSHGTGIKWFATEAEAYTAGIARARRNASAKAQEAA